MQFTILVLLAASVLNDDPKPIKYTLKKNHSLKGKSIEFLSGPGNVFGLFTGSGVDKDPSGEYFFHPVLNEKTMFVQNLDMLKKGVICDDVPEEEYQSRYLYSNLVKF